MFSNIRYLLVNSIISEARIETCRFLK